MNTEDREQALWRLYMDGRHDHARRALIEFYLPFAANIALHHYSRGADLQLDDLRQLAYVGLIEAIDRFDPAREASFSTFAAFRIKGSIINGIEKASEKRAQLAMQKRLREERAASVAPEGEGTFEKLAEAAAVLAIGFMLEDMPGLFVSEESGEDRQLEACALDELEGKLMHAIAQLPEPEQAVIQHHYLSGMDFSEIAQHRGVTKGRISQLHKSALQRLRKRLMAVGEIDQVF